MVASFCELSFDLLFSNCLELVLLHLVRERQFNDLAVLDVVVVTSVILEHSRVARHYLKLVMLVLFIFAR